MSRKSFRVVKVFTLIVMSLLLASCGKVNSGASVSLKSEPQEKQLVLKNQPEIRYILRGKFDESYDEVEEAYSYFPTQLMGSGHSNVCPIIRLTEKNKMAVVFFEYAGEDWIFMNKAIIKTDGNRYDLDFSNREVLREVREKPYVYVSEVIHYEINKENYDMLEDMANSEKTIVRFSGDKSRDLELTDENKEAIRVYLSCFEEK